MARTEPSPADFLANTVEAAKTYATSGKWKELPYISGHPRVRVPYLQGQCFTTLKWITAEL